MDSHWIPRDEVVARLTGAFRSLSPMSREKFMSDNNLMQRVGGDTRGGGVTIQDDTSISNSLVISPRRVSKFATARTRAAEALRLYEDESNTSSQRQQNEAEQHVAESAAAVYGVHYTEDQLRTLFTELGGGAPLPVSVFKKFYLGMESFGVPLSDAWVDNQLAAMGAKDSIAFNQFALLMTRVARQ